MTRYHKAAKSLSRAHEAQLLHYLKATGIKVGLLLNFGARRLQVKRMVF
jgi:GxxExxY protein